MGLHGDASARASGSRLEGYSISRVVAQSRHGFVYLANDSANAEYLIREFLPQEIAERVADGVRARDPDDRTPLRFWIRAFLERYAQLARLSHPNLPRIVRQFEVEGAACVVSTHQPGETLEDRLNSDGILAEAQLRRVLRDVLDALETVHAAGLLHRDLNPSNIWLRAGDGSARLGGFGVLRAPIRLKARTVIGCGEAPYASPEDEAVNGTQTPATDLYALAAIAYRALSGVLPPAAAARRQGADLPPLEQTVKVRCSEAMMIAVDRALAMDALERPQSVAEWREMLRGESTDEAVVAPVRPVAAEAPRNPLRFVAAAAVVASLAAFIYLGLPALSPSRAPHSPTSSATIATPTIAPTTTAATPANATPASTAVAAGSVGGPPAAADAGSALDRLAAELMARERRTQDARELQQIQQQQQQLQLQQQKLLAEREHARLTETVAASGSAVLPSKVLGTREATTLLPAAPTPAPASASTSGAVPAPAPLPSPLPAAAPVARAVPEPAPVVVASLSTTPGALVPADPDSVSRRKQLEDEEQRKARDAAAAAAAQKAAAERERVVKVVATARRKCTLAAADLSSSGNLTYESAERVPGAERVGSAVRLPPVILSDGTSGVFDVMPDNCARLVH